MKVYQILESLSSEYSSENFPTVLVCDNCEEELQDKDILIQKQSDYDSNFGDSCHFCGKTVEQEKEEQS